MNFFNAVIILIVLGTSILSCTKDDESINSEPNVLKSEESNPFDYVGQAHNDLMNYYGSQIRIIEDTANFTAKEFVEMTYVKSKDLVCKYYPVTITSSEFHLYVKSSIVSTDFELTLTERMKTLRNEHPYAIEYLNILENDVFSYLLTPELDLNKAIPESENKISKIEKQIIADKTITEQERAEILIFFSVFKYSFKQIVNEFSDPKHPLHDYYYSSAKEPLSTAQKIGIGVADARGAWTGAGMMAGTGPGGMFLGAVGMGGISSCGAATMACLYDVVADWWDSW